MEITNSVSAIDGCPAFDLIILGMGDDGHTASIFPHQIELLQAKEVCGVAIHPESGQRRITLNGPVLNNAYQVAFLVTGAAKAEKVKTDQDSWTYSGNTRLQIFIGNRKTVQAL